MTDFLLFIIILLLLAIFGRVDRIYCERSNEDEGDRD